jgi:hypothetical protein
MPRGAPLPIVHEAAAQPVADAIGRELNANIHQVVQQVAAEMPGCEVDEILATLRVRLSTVVPEAAFSQASFAARLRQEAERISASRQPSPLGQPEDR